MGKKMILIVIAIAVTLVASTGAAVAVRQRWTSPTGQHVDEPEVLDYDGMVVTVAVRTPSKEFEFWAESDAWWQQCMQDPPYNTNEYYCMTSEGDMGGKRLGDSKCFLEGLTMTCGPQSDHPTDKIYSPDFTVTFTYTTDPTADPLTAYPG